MNADGKFLSASAACVSLPDLPDEVYNSEVEGEVSEHDHPSTEIVDIAARDDAQNCARNKQDSSRANFLGRPDHKHAQEPKA